MCGKAGEIFLTATLPLGDKGHTQSPQQYMETLSRTSGLPYVMVKRNMAKINDALTNMRTVLNGLTRGLDLSILDSGMGEQFGTKLAFFPTAAALGLVMPSNSPAVNSLWLPAIPLKTPVVIKPGREEPESGVDGQQRNQHRNPTANSDPGNSFHHHQSANIAVLSPKCSSVHPILSSSASRCSCASRSFADGGTRR